MLTVLTIIICLLLLVCLLFGLQTIVFAVRCFQTTNRTYYYKKFYKKLLRLSGSILLLVLLNEISKHL